MCGLVGIVHRNGTGRVDIPLLTQMTRSLAHRGPDGEGIWVDDHVGLGHRRLSILDIAGGGQPMRDRECQRVIVYNGEIYNYRELRHQIESSRDKFRTDCDTEVLLRMAEFNDYSWLEKLNGMFALAIWDEKNKKLLLARDRLGIKPLYYLLLDNLFLFASEIRALLVHPKVESRLNRERVGEYLAYRTLAGTETMFSGIKQVEPGSTLTLDLRNFSAITRRYWQEGFDKSPGDYVDDSLPYDRQMETLLKRSVEYRLISDVPVGSFNSGGLDSSLNTAIMRSLTDGELHTFSVGFEEHAYDERQYAQLVADFIGTTHHVLVVTEKDYMAHLGKTIAHLEEPINHAHTVQLLLLSEYAKEFVTVVLTGEGADEVFGGYPRLRIPALAQYLSATPQSIMSNAVKISKVMKLRRVLKLLECAHDVDNAISTNARYVPLSDLEGVSAEVNTRSGREACLERSKSRAETTISQALYFDQRTYLPSLLLRLDKSSMASGLECRVPFLDPRLIEWSYTLPDRFKIGAVGQTKRLVKVVGERWLPKSIVYRSKVGFGTPVGQWLRNPRGLGELLDVILDSRFRQRGIFQPGVVEKLVRSHLRKEKNYEEVLWSILGLELWCREFLDNQTEKWSDRSSTQSFEDGTMVPTANEIN